MREPIYSSQFKRDVKQAQKRGKDIDKLKSVLRLLIEGDSLPKTWLDHPLRGEWQGCRDLHIEPDWVLIYKATRETVRFERIGSHSDLFD